MTVHFRPLPCPEFDLPKITKQWALMRPAGGFRTLMVDPNWRYENWSKKGEWKNASHHYKTAPVESIMQLPIGALAADDCTAFLWVTWPLMPHWAELIRAWRFEYASLAWEWLKYDPKTGRYAFGGGYGTRKNLEPCLIIRRGDPKLRWPPCVSSGETNPLPLFGVQKIPPGARSVRDFIQAMPLDCLRAPRRQHSRKPDDQYARMELLFQGPYCELFARSERKNWTSWGDELGKFGGDDALSI